MKKLFLLLVLLVVTSSVFAQEGDSETDVFVFGDLRPDAPELAARGEYGVGVQTLTLVNPDQVDILSVTADDAEPRYDRTLIVEVWYPAEIEDPTATTNYEETLGRADNPDSLVPFTFTGRAERDAAVADTDAPYPLIVVSYGYPGSRLMMTYLTENLASKGYIVAAIDHMESTYRDTAAFASTLLNRPLDIRFVIDQMAELGADGSDSFLAGVVDADNTGLIGYSMGGYGALNVAGGAYGADYIPTLSQFGFDGVDLLEVNAASNPDFAADERVKAVYAFAPWGMNQNLWDADSLSTLDVPVFFVGGSQDDVAGYEEGPHAIFELAANAERYFLTFENARHNVAPNPAPPEAENFGQFMRYGDNVWDSTRMNNINQHFATAFFGKYLKAEDTDAYLDLIEVASEGVYSTNEDGSFADDHTYWLGFPERSAVGLRLEYETGKSSDTEEADGTNLSDIEVVQQHTLNCDEVINNEFKPSNGQKAQIHEYVFDELDIQATTVEIIVSSYNPRYMLIDVGAENSDGYIARSVRDQYKNFEEAQAAGLTDVSRVVLGGLDRDDLTHAVQVVAYFNDQGIAYKMYITCADG